MTRFLHKLQILNPLYFLAIGGILMALSHLNYRVELFAFFAMAPFLLYLRQTKGFKSRILFFLVLTASWSLIVLKIITPPIPYLFIFLYSIPIALIHLPAYLMYARFADLKWGSLLFPATFVTFEWIQYTFTPLGSWGAAAYTQSHHLNLMQSLSIFGTAGLSFLIYWVNCSVSDSISSGKLSFRTIGLPLSLVAILLIFGSIRINEFERRDLSQLKVAAVGSDSEIGGPDLPSRADNEGDIHAIFNRSRKAAAFGAEIIVWNEAAFFLLPENEAVWQDSFSRLAMQSSVELMASYVLLESTNPFRYENKYLLYNKEGELVYTYHKHQPVPGEPAIKGQEEFQTYDNGKTRLAGAICYDYDFPYIAAAQTKKGAAIVGLPSSDWKGIDPLHTEMAAFRAVEQGISIVRSTRFGYSAAINPIGQITAGLSAYDLNDKILIGHLPVEGRPTLYRSIGDSFVYACLLFILSFLLWSFFRKKKANNF